MRKFRKIFFNKILRIHLRLYLIKNSKYIFEGRRPFEPWKSLWKILVPFELQGSWTVDTKYDEEQFQEFGGKINSLHSHTFFSFDN